MAKCKMVAEIKYSWYVRNIYIPSLSLFEDVCIYLGIETRPDWDLISKTISKHAVVKIKVIKVK